MKKRLQSIRLKDEIGHLVISQKIHRLHTTIQKTLPIFSKIKIDDIMVGDLVYVPYCGRLQWLLVVDVSFPYMGFQNKDDHDNLYRYGDYLQYYWASKYCIEIDCPTMILSCTEFGGGVSFSYPNTIVLKVKRNTFVRKILKL